MHQLILESVCKRQRLLNDVLEIALEISKIFWVDDLELFYRVVVKFHNFRGNMLVETFAHIAAAAVVARIADTSSSIRKSSLDRSVFYAFLAKESVHAHP